MGTQLSDFITSPAHPSTWNSKVGTHTDQASRCLYSNVNSGNSPHKNNLCVSAQGYGKQVLFTSSVIGNCYFNKRRPCIVSSTKLGWNQS